MENLYKQKNIHILLDLKFLYEPSYRMHNFKNCFQVARLVVQDFLHTKFTFVSAIHLVCRLFTHLQKHSILLLI